MSYILSVVLILLSMVIFAFLQLTPGLFTIFYHSRLAKTSKKRADDQSLSFILGTEIFSTTIWILVYFIIFALFYNVPDFNQGIFPFVMAGICLAEASVSFFFYFRSNKQKPSTATFITRHNAHTLTYRAKTIKNRSDCIMLGFVSNIPELIFTIPLFIICTNILQDTPALPRAVIIIAFVIIPAIPLLVIRSLYQKNYNLANIQRLRAKLIIHFRIILALTYLAIAFTLLNIGLLQNG